MTDELRAAGILVMNYTPSKGRDKIMYTVAPLFEADSGHRTEVLGQVIEEVLSHGV